MKPLIEQLAAEYASIHPSRHKAADQFSDKMMALCSLLDRLVPGLLHPSPETHQP